MGGSVGGVWIFSGTTHNNFIVQELQGGCDTGVLVLLWQNNSV